MTPEQTSFLSIRQNKFILLLIISTACIILTIGLDLLDSKIQDSSFYLSESFMFSSFWWLFIPLLYAQFSNALSPQTKVKVTLWVLLPIAIHLFAYPALIWLISGLFYSHTFEYLQTFQYGLTAYLFILCAVYSIPFLLYTSFKTELSGKLNSRMALANFIVIDGNKRTSINTKDILFLASNPPYINIPHTAKMYIHKETLKSVSEKLDHSLFVRVHKSTILNISKVHSYKSRLNGDYDLLLSDGTEIRLSRNFASQFKLQFQETHRDAP